MEINKGNIINEIKISEMPNNQGVKITLNSGIYIEPYVPFEKDDVCVCLPGFTTEDAKSNGIGAGSGYKENFIFKIYRTSNKKSHSSEKYLQIHWPADTGNGIYERGIRRATLEEENAFYAGITNLNDIPTKKLFKISYVSTSGEIKKEEVFAFIESEAVATLKDLKSINYIMSDSSVTERDFVDPQPVVIMERPQVVYTEKTQFDVVVINSGPAKLGVVKLVKEVVAAMKALQARIKALENKEK